MEQCENTIQLLASLNSSTDKFNYIREIVTQFVAKYPNNYIDLPTPIKTVSSIVNDDKVENISLVINVTDNDDLTQKLKIPFLEKLNHYLIPNFSFTGNINKVSGKVTGNGDELKIISPEKLINILEKVVLQFRELCSENLSLIYDISYDFKVDDLTNCRLEISRDKYSNNGTFTLKEIHILED